MRKLLFTLLLIILPIILCSCSQMKSFESNFNKYEVDGINLTNADLSFYFDIENPNTTPLGIKEITYQVALDGNNVTSGTFEGFSLNAKEKKLVRFPIELQYSKIAGTAFNMVKKFISRNGTVKYKFEGEATVVDNVGFTAKVPIQAEGEANLF